ncbi:DNA alkylation repair protein [Lutimonas halocynthiae]|uniref:DNA alkylation repair protein n=1 Tax=Lutimonas halocynthiae TaxID=1446477 RepID=UPI0025B34EC7|nr:DNA alkylation repair protein [Lutimonas halocynthiae]MDN3643310.1 DNA alkylation repair protein [Lutimonas halocynthiae]
MKLEEVLACLYDLQDAEVVRYKEKKFGAISHNSLGIYHKDLRVIAKEIGRNNDLALQLFDSGIYEARLLCSKIFNPKDLTAELMETWVITFENWEICDSFCMGLFAKSELAIDKIQNWTKREAEFEKRAGFAIMAAYCMADKKAANVVFETFLPIIKREANDDRLYVRKAVNWALRSIGKRNIDLNLKAIQLAHEIVNLDSKASKWIGKDAIRKLELDTVNILDYPRAIYRPL